MPTTAGPFMSEPLCLHSCNYYLILAALPAGYHFNPSRAHPGTGHTNFQRSVDFFPFLLATELTIVKKKIQAAHLLQSSWLEPAAQDHLLCGGQRQGSSSIRPPPLLNPQTSSSSSSFYASGEEGRTPGRRSTSGARPQVSAAVQSSVKRHPSQGFQSTKTHKQKLKNLEHF